MTGGTCGTAGAGALAAGSATARGFLRGLAPGATLARALRPLAALAALCLAAAPALAAGCPAEEFPPRYADAATFETALAATEGIVAPDPAPSALVVPHHLLVADLIAAGLRLGIASRPDRILLISPDHFNESPRPFATASRGFATVLGPVPADPALAAALLAHPDLVADSCLFHAEHGVRALLPFLARLYPGVPVTPLSVANGSALRDWAAMAEVLAPLVGPGTLMIQSSDFSHYLPQHLARQRDQQVLNLLSAGDLAGIARLSQPGHVDSVGALWLTATLQARVRGAVPVVAANRNQQELSTDFVAETTSYMVILYQPPELAPPDFPGATHFMLAGDLFLGRDWPGLLHDEIVARRVARAALSATRGLPLVANLEGVLLPEMPRTLAHMTLAMPAGLLADWAARLNIRGLGLANNHAMDVGASGLAETEAALREAEIPAIRQGETLEMGGVALVALTDLDPTANPQTQVLDAPTLDRLIRADAETPVIALVHWGEEWVTEPGPREAALIREIGARGVAAIVGAHPHAASAAPVAVAGGDMLVIQSLGNFMFDQTSPPASGALAEVTRFAQGTIFVRQLPLPALYDTALGRDHAGPDARLRLNGDAPRP